MESSIFLAFNLPNAASWFYFSLLLTVALFFHFARPFSTRNFDLLTLFLLVPGFLLLQEVQVLQAEAAVRATPGVAGLPELTSRGWEAASPGIEYVDLVARTTEALVLAETLRVRADREQLVAYVWLLVGSAYWFGRALVDLALLRRPPVSPNLTNAGMTWLGLTLFACMVAVAVHRTGEPLVRAEVGARPIPISQVQNGAAALVGQTQSKPATAAELRFWADRALALACHAAVVVGLVMIGFRHFQDTACGVGLGTLYLLVPYTAYHVAQFHLVWPAAFVTWAVFAYRRPALSGWLLGLAAGSAFVPLFLFPLWAGFYAGRGLGRFTGWFLAALGLSLGVTVGVLLLDGRIGTGVNWEGMSDWLPWRRPSGESLWTGVPGAYRLPIFIVYVGFVVAVAFWPSPKTLSHLVALSAAVLLGVQFWHADRGGVYVMWYLPLILLMVFRPNLAAHAAQVIEPGGGLFAWAGAAWRRVRTGRSAADAKELAV